MVGYEYRVGVGFEVSSVSDWIISDGVLTKRTLGIYTEQMDWFGVILTAALQLDRLRFAFSVRTVVFAHDLRVVGRTFETDNRMHINNTCRDIYCNVVVALFVLWSVSARVLRVDNLPFPETADHKPFVC